MPEINPHTVIVSSAWGKTVSNRSNYFITLFIPRFGLSFVTSKLFLKHRLSEVFHTVELFQPFSFYRVLFCVHARFSLLNYCPESWVFLQDAG